MRAIRCLPPAGTRFRTEQKSRLKNPARQTRRAPTRATKTTIRRMRRTIRARVGKIKKRATRQSQQVRARSRIDEPSAPSPGRRAAGGENRDAVVPATLEPGALLDYQL